MKRVIEYLKEQGISSIYEGEFLSFSYHDLNYIYLKDERDEDFYSMFIPGILKVDDSIRYKVLDVINEINNQIKLVKFVVNGEYVWAGIEQKFIIIADYNEIMTYSMELLNIAYRLFCERWEQVNSLN